MKAPKTLLPTDVFPGPNGDPNWRDQVQIRHINDQDLPALEWEGEYSRFRRLYAEAYRRATLGLALIWVADLPGTGVIGQLFVQLQSERHELADGFQRAHIHSFRMRPSYRGAGVGTRMLLVAEVDLLGRGFCQATLNVARQNKAALRLYKRQGYQVVAAEPGRWMYLDEKGQMRTVHEPSWRMQKNLK